MEKKTEDLKMWIISGYLKQVKDISEKLHG
jgi:hypothetical protein